MSEAVERKRQAKRQSILDAAARLFAHHGYHATRMADIAEELGLQKAALYYYFPSKEALLVELIRTRVGVALEALEAIAADDSIPPDAKIEAAIRSHLHRFHEHGDIYTIFNSERLHAVSSEAASIVDVLGRRYEKIWAALLAHGARQAAIRPALDLPVVVKGILGTLNNTLTWFDPNGRLTVEGLADIYVDFILSALAAPGRPKN